MAEAQLRQFLDKVRQLNAFVALSEADPQLRQELRDCEHHDQVVALARRCGFEIGRRWGEGPASSLQAAADSGTAAADQGAGRSAATMMGRGCGVQPAQVFATPAPSLAAVAGSAPLTALGNAAPAGGQDCSSGSLAAREGCDVPAASPQSGALQSVGLVSAEPQCVPHSPAAAPDSALPYQPHPGVTRTQGGLESLRSLLVGPCPPPGEELTEVLIETPLWRLERIHSCAYRSPDGFWYEQQQDEWVMLLQGTARVRCADQPNDEELRPGDSLWLRAGRRHRVTATDPAPGTIWLALFWQAA